jgi:hypothetical protein
VNATDLNSWRTTTIVLIVISVAMFAIQRSSFRFLDIVFEFCIFYVPTMIAAGVYLYYKKKVDTPIVAVQGA